MRLSIDKDSSGAWNASATARASLAFTETGSLTNGSGYGLPRAARSASQR